MFLAAAQQTPHCNGCHELHASDLIHFVSLSLQLKGVLMAIYFGADHVVWAGQAGLISNKTILERYFAQLALHTEHTPIRTTHVWLDVT